MVGQPRCMTPTSRVQIRPWEKTQVRVFLIKKAITLLIWQQITFFRYIEYSRMLQENKGVKTLLLLHYLFLVSYIYEVYLLLFCLPKLKCIIWWWLYFKADWCLLKSIIYWSIWFHNEEKLRTKAESCISRTCKQPCPTYTYISKFTYFLPSS